MIYIIIIIDIIDIIINSIKKFKIINLNAEYIKNFT